MTRKRFELLKKDFYLRKVRISDDKKSYYIHSINGFYINVSFEGPIPEPYYYSTLTLMKKKTK